MEICRVNFQPQSKKNLVLAEKRYGYKIQLTMNYFWYLNYIPKIRDIQPITRVGRKTERRLM